MAALRVAFAGTPAFAATALEAIAAAGFEIPLVLTQPDRPAGRGLRLSPSAVAHAAEALQLTISKPASLRTEEARQPILDARPDVIVVAAYGLLLPAPVLGIPAHGCINIHASLLPRWRGAAPIHRAILAGDSMTGISIMQMDAGLDTGPVLLERAVPIGDRETTGALTDRLAHLGAEAVVEALRGLGRWAPRAQDATKATYAAKIAKSEARIDWSRPNVEIDRRVRAFNPAPGAETQLAGSAIKIWTAEPVPGRGGPGEVLEARGTRLVVACGEGALRIDSLQKAGGRRLEAAEFIRGVPIAEGSVLAIPAA